MKSVSIPELQKLIIDYDSDLKAALVSSDGPQLHRLCKKTFGLRFNDAVVEIPATGDTYALFKDLLQKLAEIDGL